MHTIEMKNVGVKFDIRNKQNDTLRDTVLSLLSRKSRQSAENFSKENFWALRDISFSLEKGDCLGVLGRNGAGKSTLLQILTGIYQPDEGTVTTNGKIGLLQLGTGFHDELTGRENIYLNGAILGLKRKEIDTLYESIVSFAELEDFIDTPIKNYSTGMRSRLSFAIAINIKPDILLIDEVLSVGDESFKQKSRKEIESILVTGITVILVSHALSDIQTICNKAICLHKGRLVNKGNTTDVISYYKELL